MTIEEVKVFLNKLELGDNIGFKTNKKEFIGTYLSNSDLHMYFLGETDYQKVEINKIIEIEMS